MELFEYYLRYLTALCEGSLQVPGLTPGQGDETARAMALQQQIAAMGLPEFVRRCAAAEGTRIPQAVYDSYDPQALAQAMQALLAKAGQEAPQDAPGQQAEKAPEKESGEDAPRQNAYEAMLDCLSLEDALLQYLIEVLKTEDELAFFRLSQVTVRRELKLHDFLYWFATKELYAQAEERACVTMVDALLTRLAGEGQLEQVAALLSGDRTTYEITRSQAEELRQAPDATWEWFETYYLNRYYPLRMILKLRGVRFPEFKL